MAGRGLAGESLRPHKASPSAFPRHLTFLPLIFPSKFPTASANVFYYSLNHCSALWSLKKYSGKILRFGVISP